MKKNYFLNLFVLISFTLWAQIPAGYYNTATGTGYTLKTQLRNIIASGHVDKGYDALYNAYKTTDTDLFYENDNSVLDMYSENPTGPDPYNYQHNVRLCGTYSSENQCYNREHIFPQGFFNSIAPMVSDAHHITPTDGYVNNRRSNYPFGKVNAASWTSQNGSKVGSSATAGYSGTVFEPINEFKGDIARMLLYFAVRYENEVLSGGWDAHNSAPENTLDGTKTQFYEEWYIKLLLSWHVQDPVSAREISRNNAIYAYQGNRNPFIDNQDYALQIWGHLIDVEAPSIPTNLNFSNVSYTSLTLNWTASTDNVAVTGYNIFKDNVFLATTSNLAYNVTGLSTNTTYNFKVQAKDAAGNLSGFSTVVSPTTLTDGEAPTNPTNLTSSNVSSTGLTLNWSAATDNVGVTAYDIFKDDVYLISTANVTYNITGLTASTSYDFKVRAKDAVGNLSGFSNILNVTTTSGSGGGSGTVCGTETFTNIPAASSSYSTRNWTGDNGIVWNATDSRTDNTINGKAITVRAGILSSGLIPNGISELTVSTKLPYSDPSGSFNVKINGNVVGSIPYSTTTQTSTITGINIAGDIIISVDKSSNSHRVSIDDLTWKCYDATASVNEYANSLFNVYPNPAMDKRIMIKIDHSVSVEQIEIINVTGKTIRSVKNPEIINNTITVQDLPTGFFIVKIKSDQGIAHKKIIVN